jgi:hypothetical protein
MEEEFQDTFGDSHVETLSHKSALAKVFYNLGEIETQGGVEYEPGDSYLDGAEWRQVLVVEGRVEMLGPKHPDTLISKHSLALTRKLQGKTAEAMDLMRECAKAAMEVFPPSHPDYTNFPARLAQWETEMMGSIPGSGVGPMVMAP